MAATPSTARAGAGNGAVEGHADQHRPLAGYGVLTAAFNGALAAFVVSAERHGRLPERYAMGDLGLLAVGTFKLSRLVAKDRVTSVLRAPFSRFQEDVGHGEVAEAARGRGLRRAVGELLVCEYCVAQWVAAAAIAGHALAPRATRTVAALFTVQAAADALQVGYSRLLEAGD